MRCRKCSAENEADAKFCVECGSKMSVPHSMVVLCDGKDEDGKICSAELLFGNNFCKNCGKKIDPKIFEGACSDEKCTGFRDDGTPCDTVLSGTSSFCPKCGTKRLEKAEKDTPSAPATITKETLQHDGAAQVDMQSDNGTGGDSAASDNAVAEQVQHYTGDSVRMQHHQQYTGQPVQQTTENKDMELTRQDEEQMYSNTEENAFEEERHKTEEQQQMVGNVDLLKASGTAENLVSSQQEQSGVMTSMSQSSDQKYALETMHGDDNSPMLETERTVNDDLLVHRKNESFTAEGSGDSPEGGAKNLADKLHTVDLEDAVDKENNKNANQNNSCKGGSVIQETVPPENVSALNVEREVDEEAEDEEEEDTDENSDSDSSSSVYSVPDKTMDTATSSGQSMDGQQAGTKRKGQSQHQPSKSKQKRKAKRDKKSMKGNVETETGKYSKTKTPRGSGKLKKQQKEQTKKAQEQNKTPEQNATDQKFGGAGEAVLNKNADRMELSASVGQQNNGDEAKQTSSDKTAADTQHATSTGTTGFVFGECKPLTPDFPNVVNPPKLFESVQTKSDVTQDKPSSQNEANSKAKEINQKEVNKNSTVKKTGASKEKQNLKSTDKQAELRSNRVKNMETITVTFHVLLSKDFGFDPTTSVLQVNFGEALLGGWDSDGWRLKVVRHLDHDMREMTCDVDFPVPLIGKKILYKYNVLHTDGKKKDKRKWEGYYISWSVRPSLNNRTMEVGIICKNTRIWHQFDGVVHPEAGWIQRITSSLHKEKDLLEEATFCAKYFLPEWFQPFTKGSKRPDSSVEDSITRLGYILHGLKTPYFVDGKCGSDAQVFKEQIGRSMLSGVVGSMQQITKENETNEMRERMFITALAILSAVSKLNLPFKCLTYKEKQVVLSAVLIQPDKTNKNFIEKMWIEQYFKDTRMLQEGLIACSRHMAKTSKNPSWIYALPLFHFLSNMCQPFEVPKKSTDHNNPVPTWWGITKELDDCIASFKEKKQDPWVIPLVKVIETLGPLFEMDYLLPRALVASLNILELKVAIESRIIPVEVSAASLIYHIRMTYFPGQTVYLRYTYSSWDDYKIIPVVNCFDALLKCVQAVDVPNEISEDMIVHCWMSYKIAEDLLQFALPTGIYRHVFPAIKVFLHAVAIYELALSKSNPDQPKTRHRSEHLSAVDTMSAIVIEWINKLCYTYYDKMETNFALWNSALVGNQLQIVSVKEQWDLQIMEAFERSLGKACTYTGMKIQLVEMYCRKVDSYHSSMQDCLTKAAFKAVQDGYNLNTTSFQPEEKKRFSVLISQLFGQNWEREVERKPDDSSVSILRHVLKWQPFVHFLRMFYKDSDKNELLTTTCVEQIVMAISVIEQTEAELLKGSITVGQYEDIVAAENKFPALVSLVCTGNAEERKRREAAVLCALKMRQMEVEMYQLQAERLTSLTALCQHLGVCVTNELDKAIEKKKRIASIRFHDLCKMVNVLETADIDQYQPFITAFPVSDMVTAILPDAHYCCKSNVFMKIWQGICRQKGKDCQVLDDMITNIWNLAFDRWNDVSRRITNGEIHFKEMELLIGSTYKDNYPAMVGEMKVMKVAEKIGRERTVQLQKQRQLEACVRGAKVILQFAKEYKLTGDFGPIQQLTKNQGDSEMRSFDDSMMKTCEFLKEIDEQRSKCLDVFVKCSELVTWLKKSMREGLKELKVFVDLAYISAGDTPIEIDRVQCLHSAVTGYASLIFELKTNSGYRQLLKSCEDVWKELKANKKLPAMLKDTCRQLEWLKNVQKAHGSVEVTSLEQSRTINAVGIYCIGYKAREDQKPDEEMDLSSVLMLTVPEDKEGKRMTRHYTFSQLQDLQSRLMLVAGKAEKGKDDVERFTTIFDSVTRLANVYLKLCSAGCVLFKNWQAKFLCDQKREVCTFLEFGQGVNQLKGKTSDLTEMIPMIAGFMETCHRKWLKYINQKRKDHLHLNYFTIDQLVFLQKELVKVGSEEPSGLIYPLLSALKENCMPQDLVEAMRSAEQDLEGYGMEVTEEEVHDPAEVDQQDDEEQKTENFIKEIVDSGYSENVARKALEVLSPDQIAEAVLWCFEYVEEHGDEMTDDLGGTDGQAATETASLTTYKGWVKSDKSILASIAEGLKGAGRDIKASQLIADLETLWASFLESVSSSCLTDYLSVEHLGMILQKLEQQSQSTILRRFQPIFRKGQPNLIVCPSADILNTVLTIYSVDSDQPLPTPDEVLMCTKNTNLDQVDIFWRRALFDSQSKIHCLVNADLLDFEVSDQGEAILEEYVQELQHTDPEYKLVVICSTDNENRSRIVAALDRYRRPPLPLHTSYLKKYLLKKLQVKDSIGGNMSAASLDFEKSSVRLVKSWRAGVGKTLYKSRRVSELGQLQTRSRQDTEAVSIPLQEKEIDVSFVAQTFLKHTKPPGTAIARIFHVDVAHEVQEGVDYLLFNLLILGSVTDKAGHVWQKSPRDLYLIETMPLMTQSDTNRGAGEQYVHHILEILPEVTCRAPQESLNIFKRAFIPPDIRDEDQLFDRQQFASELFQRPYQYLSRLDRGQELVGIDPFTAVGREQDCLEVLLRHCGVLDPSWSELHHFVWFLNTQLKDFEMSSFLGAAAAEDLPGFAKFTLRFLIQMSRDFATRSLEMSEESAEVRMVEEEEGLDEREEEEDLTRFQMRRTWESSPHPYLFFNPDHHSITFLGFNIERRTGNLRDQQTGRVLEEGIMQANLYDALVRNLVPIQENFDDLPRSDKIMKLCSVMGVDMPHDPDDTYELTTDNVKKIMAIYMRFRCYIPVIIMGETGCGKTRLVKFMCALQTPPGVDVKNMILMKVHGGTTNADIIRKVHDAERIAAINAQQFPHMYTVLFFDEANTTESIGLIKEIMCDRSIAGEPLKLSQNLKMVAACNPYRKHSEELIKKLEQAGLGYHVDADKTTDRLGRVPMRRLVYRVQPLPQSLLPLVWDFGQLNTHVEDLYIRQMVRRYIRDDRLPDVRELVEVVSAILTASQDYMRDQKDECSFVSLRDVDRVLSVMSWFYREACDDRTLFNRMDEKLGLQDDDDGVLGIMNDDDDDDDEVEEEEEEENDNENELDDVTRSLVLALGVCYHACLKTRDEYRSHVAPFFREPCALPGGAEQISQIIECCQDIFLENVQLEKNIARNMALKENVFMMVVCIELRIPLFLVGKPGSSKSLAKTIVADAMQGNAAHKEMFKQLKQVQMVSFQCSPLSTPDGIVGTFRQCAQFQKDKDLERFVSVVVLDEVGLAEDSPRMPLKTLHPLLEDGCQGDEKPEAYKKVAFIGISNWALDPAKMNRGILVQREIPDIDELKASAEGICTGRDEKNWMKPLVEPMAKSYLELFREASTSLREFFGLRDFYSLIKMVYLFAEKSRRMPTWHQLLHSISRNFGGLDDVEPIVLFAENLRTVIVPCDEPERGDPDCSPAGLIKACLINTNKSDSESRYLLLLTENYGALTILQQQIFAIDNAVIIFGSSFPSDQEYTQVCRNINRIKVCMETGNTVVLLNLENLYESLYDALNQYYVYFGGERYVDLGLGSHRVKCRVHKNFRLIVVAEKQVVYKKFPIPLINRLEKHFLTINTMLSDEQRDLAQQLELWAEEFASEKVAPFQTNGEKKTKFSVRDVFMGYHDDTCPAIILHIWERLQKNLVKTEVLEEAKKMLLWSAVPDAVVRLGKSCLTGKEQDLWKNEYFEIQRHNSLCSYLNYKLEEEKCEEILAQVTTHSKLLSAVDKSELSAATRVRPDCVMMETLQSFDTEQQFNRKIRSHFEKRQTEEARLLLVQCDSGDMNANLVACARYCVLDIYQTEHEKLRAPVHVVFIVQLPRIAGGCFTGFQCGKWHSVHIDDLRASDEAIPSIQEMQNKTIADLFHAGVTGETDMDVDEPQTSEISDQERNVKRIEESMDVEEEELHSDMARHNTTSPSPEEPLQMEDAILQLYAAGSEGTVTQSTNQGSQKSHKLNVHGLILSCVQSALAMVKDSNENSTRTTQRVDILLTLLQENIHERKKRGQGQGAPSTFCQGLSSLMASLLKEKETKLMNRQRAEQWMPNEAAHTSTITKAGTFRRACIQVVESKITPILAGILAFLDTNSNLDILQDSGQSWKTALWLAFLNTPQALQLTYSDLQSPTRQKELTEVIVKETGCDGHSFKSEMPFSWLIYDWIEQLRTESISMDSENVDRNEVLLKLLADQPQGKILLQFDTDEVRDEILQCYLSDFVHVVYHSFSGEEHLLVCQSVLYLMKRVMAEREWHHLLHCLLAIHEAHAELRPRLVYFHDMNRVWTNCSTTILKMKKEQPDHYMFREEEFTFSALALLIESLEPQGQKTLDDASGRTEWLKRVYRCRPVVEKVMHLQSEDPQQFGNHSSRSVFTARCLWTKVMIMKLFLEHVCSTGKGESKITIKNCMTFWKMLGNEADMKKPASLECVEKFLKMCNKAAQKEYLGKQEICSHCESAVEGLPVVLPCSHVICDSCFNELKAMATCSCPTCKQDFQEEHEPKENENKRLGIQKFRDYQKRCNSFFMNVVSQLCFADNQPPSDEVVIKLLGYITLESKHSKTLQTKDLTIFDCGLDPNPVFRSFLLQLLLRTSEERVEVNLERYLDNAKAVLRQDNIDAENDLITLCLLVIQCLEDLLFQEAVQRNEIQVAVNYLRQARNGMHGEMVEKLYSLAKARFGLAVAAKQIRWIVEEKPKTVPVDIRRVIEAAENLCMDNPCKWPRIYLVKYLCRFFGQNSYHAVCKTELRYLRWIRLADIDQKVECADRYIVCGPAYQQIREAVTQVALGENLGHLDNLIGELQGSGRYREWQLHLALHREVTSTSLYPADNRKIRREVIESLERHLLQSDVVKNKEFMQAVLRNEIGNRCQLLHVEEGQDLQTQGIQCLLMHCYSALTDLQTDGTLLEPIHGLMTRPHQYQTAYLPTMPQDDLADVREALLAARNTPAGASENPVFYRCPNGHPYVIGNCGRPATIGRCHTCGQEIGGLGYQLRQGNVQDQGDDQTQTGHILGRAERRGTGPITERSLSEVSCVCVRLITHLAMLLGATKHPQAIQTMIKPALDAGHVSWFLWDHITQNLEDLQRVLGRSLDDVLLLIHSIVHSMVANVNAGAGVDQQTCRWSSKKARDNWEKRFCAVYLDRHIQTAGAEIEMANNMLLNDKRLGADPLLRLLHEIDRPDERVSLENLQEVPSVWRYRSKISLEHLQQDFTAKMNDKKGAKKHKVLQLFLKEEHLLEAMQYIPSVLKLHRILIQKYQRKLDRAEASTITVSSLLRHGGHELRDLIDDFSRAWDLVRDSLQMYACPTDQGAMVVPKEYCRMSVDAVTPISMLLPTIQEAGLCSYVMLDFLFRKQNDVLDRYCRATGRNHDSVGVVRVNEVTSAHLISFHRDQDLLPMVLANCQYSFEVGTGTKIEYDFSSLERQIMDRFLYSKSRIEIKGTIQINQMVYRSEYTNAMVFRKLQEKIPQEGLGAAVKHQVCEDIRTLPELCLSIDNLDIAISFLKSIGGNPEESLESFMMDKLKMTVPLQSQKARQFCQFRHTQALWILMSLLKAKLLAGYPQGRQDVFDRLHNDHREDLPDEVQDELQTYLRELTIERLNCLMEVMFECIILVISVTQNPDDEDYVDNKNQKLRDIVMVHAQDMEPAVLDIQILTHFPEEVLCKHCAATWLLVYDILHDKKTGKRRH